MTTIVHYHYRCIVDGAAGGSNCIAVDAARLRRRRRRRNDRVQHMAGVLVLRHRRRRRRRSTSRPDSRRHTVKERARVSSVRAPSPSVVTRSASPSDRPSHAACCAASNIIIVILLFCFVCNSFSSHSLSSSSPIRRVRLESRACYNK